MNENQQIEVNKPSELDEQNERNEPNEPKNSMSSIRLMC